MEEARRESQQIFWLVIKLSHLHLQRWQQDMCKSHSSGASWRTSKATKVAHRVKEVKETTVTPAVKWRDVIIDVTSTGDCSRFTAAVAGCRGRGMLSVDRHGWLNSAPDQREGLVGGLVGGLAWAVKHKRSTIYQRDLHEWIHKCSTITIEIGMSECTKTWNQERLSVVLKRSFFLFFWAKQNALPFFPPSSLYLCVLLFSLLLMLLLTNLFI